MAMGPAEPSGVAADWVADGRGTRNNAATATSERAVFIAPPPYGWVTTALEEIDVQTIERVAWSCGLILPGGSAMCQVRSHLQETHGDAVGRRSAVELYVSTHRTDGELRKRREAPGVADGVVTTDPELRIDAR